VEALLDQRVQAGDRLVEDQELGLVHEGLDETHFLAAARGQLVHRPVQRRVEALDQLIADGGIDPSAQRGEVVQDGSAGQLGMQREVAGQEADAAADLPAVGAAVQVEQRGRPRGRPDQVEQQPHRRRLAGAVGAEEPEDLAAPHLEVEGEHAVAVAVVLGQRARLDRCPAGRRARHRARAGDDARRGHVLRGSPTGVHAGIGSLMTQA